MLRVGEGPRLRRFVEFVSADVPELGSVPVARLAEALERFLLLDGALKPARARASNRERQARFRARHGRTPAGSSLPSV